jgi:hypothetical protein
MGFDSFAGPGGAPFYPRALSVVAFARRVAAGGPHPYSNLTLRHSESESSQGVNDEITERLQT